MIKRSIFIACVVAGFLTVNATAGDREVEPFHGVALLASPLEIRSASAGLNARYDGKIGPYASDAVVLISYQAEMNYVGAREQDHMHVVVKLDGQTEAEQWRSASIISVGPSTWPAQYVLAGEQRIFIPKGEVRTLQITAENQGEMDPAKAITIARMHLTPLAAKG